MKPPYPCLCVTNRHICNCECAHSSTEEQACKYNSHKGCATHDVASATPGYIKKKKNSAICQSAMVFQCAAACPQHSYVMRLQGEELNRGSTLESENLIIKQSQGTALPNTQLDKDA